MPKKKHHLGRKHLYYMVKAVYPTRIVDLEAFDTYDQALKYIESQTKTDHYIITQIYE